MAALLAACSSENPAGDGSSALEARGTRPVLEKLVAGLRTESGPQTPVEPTALAPTPPMESPEAETGVEAPGAAEICVPDMGPVTVMVLNNGQAVRSAAAQYAGERVLHRSSETVIFENGRVITSNVAEVSDRLNDLGWSGRDVKLLGSRPRHYASSGGVKRRTASDGKQERSPKNKKKKRRRRRG